MLHAPGSFEICWALPSRSLGGQTKTSLVRLKFFLSPLLFKQKFGLDLGPSHFGLLAILFALRHKLRNICRRCFNIVYLDLYLHTGLSFFD